MPILLPVKRLAGRTLRRFGLYEPLMRLRPLIQGRGTYPGLRWTPKRLFNLYLVR